MYPDEQPPEAAEQEANPRRPIRRPRSLPVAAAAAAVVVVLLASVTVLAWPAVFRPTAAATGGEVFLEPATAPGQDPFTDTLIVGNPPGTKSQTPLGGSGSGIVTVTGDASALYGGSLNEKVCDRAKLIAFLQAHPDKAAAWAGVLGIPTGDIATYIGALTPVQLRADTRVTNHGFKDGHATTLQSVLQAGTAVLVDDQGRPRVKCGCGNPLLDPVATPVTPVYTGARWDSFSERGVAAVVPASRPVDRFLVYDLTTDQTFSRPRGTDGTADVPVVTATPAPGPFTSPTPVVAPPVGRCATGTHLQSGRCVHDEPAACTRGEIRVSGQCVPAPVVCLAGSHPAPDGRSCDQDDPPGIHCSDGFHPSDDGTSCDPDTPTCDNGQHLDQDTNTCVDNVICPTGSHSVGHGTSCKPNPCPDGQQRGDDGNCHCPDGTQLVGDSCISTPPPCPEGSQSDGNDSCHPTPCPDGSAPDPNGNCPVPATRLGRRASPARRGGDRAGSRRRPTDPGGRDRSS